MKNHYILLLLLFISFSCSPKDGIKKDSVKSEDTLFQGIEIPIYYDYDWQAISFDISINGNDTLYAVFDTGADGVSIPQNLKDNYFKYRDSLHVTANKYSKVFTEDVNFVRWDIGRRSSEDDFSEPRVLIGWDFFENEIIELSFNNKYIRILDNTDHLIEYDSISFIKEKNGLFISTLITIQEKKVNVLSLIDTGFNSTIISDKSIFTNLDYTESEKIYAIFSGDKRFSGNLLLADTIKVGNSNICNKNICITDKNEINGKRKIEKSLIGCGFFENFTVVLDFKNNTLYMKPIKDLNSVKNLESAIKNIEE